MIEVICKQCTASVIVADGRDVHEALQCSCCPDGHHHGQAAAECPRDHDGPCWNPPSVPDKPDGCTVCRPLIIRPAVVMRPFGG